MLFFVLNAEVSRAKSSTLFLKALEILECENSMKEEKQKGVEIYSVLLIIVMV